MTSNCNRFYGVVANNTCYDITQAKNTTLDELYTWNPALQGDCSGLESGYYICVGIANTIVATTITRVQDPTTSTTPSTTTTSSATATRGGAAPPGSTQSGIPADCNRWVMQQTGLYCYDMAQKGGITLDRLYALNSGLGGDCSGLWVGCAYCLSAASGN
ncbi:hypothetical protein LTR66_000587 [Elasticomyces elasticus]|nr:hypothetical protein LTR66_000587 [Elasticomyces elasticus]